MAISEGIRPALQVCQKPFPKVVPPRRLVNNLWQAVSSAKKETI
jgi:hypothetical protein